LCTEANRTRRRYDGKGVKTTWKAKECQKPGRNGDDGMQEQQPIRTNHIDRRKCEEDTGGWIASEELLRQLRDVVGWKEPPVLLAKRNMDLMPRLRSLEQALVLIPWQDGASQIIEVIDRLVEIPLLVPSSYMIRAHGKPLKDKPWLLAQIDTPKKAETWKLFHRRFFKEDDRKPRIIEAMTKLWPRRSESQRSGIGLAGSSESVSTR